MKAHPGSILAPLLLAFIVLPLPAQEETDGTLTIPATDLDALFAHEGTAVTVKGFVDEASVNLTGIHFLNFRDSDFVCVTFAQQVRAFGDQPPADTYREQWVAVSGTLEKYRGKPQIKLASPEQIRVLEAPTDPETPAAEPATEMTEAPPEGPQPTEPSAPATDPDGVELVDGKPPVDWKLYFPVAKP